MANTNKTPKAQETKKAETKKVNPIEAITANLPTLVKTRGTSSSIYKASLFEGQDDKGKKALRRKVRRAAFYPRRCLLLEHGSVLTRKQRVKQKEIRPKLLVYGKAKNALFLQLFCVKGLSASGNSAYHIKFRLLHAQKQLLFYEMGRNSERLRWRMKRGISTAAVRERENSASRSVSGERQRGKPTP